MKILKTASFNKLAKEKEWDPNPWAVCHTTVDKDEEPAKYERCVQKVKKQQETKPLKDRGSLMNNEWDADKDFSNRLKDEMSGFNDDTKDIELNDKWERLFGKKPTLNKKPEMVKPFKR